MISSTFLKPICFSRHRAGGPLSKEMAEGDGGANRPATGMGKNHEKNYNINKKKRRSAVSYKTLLLKTVGS